MAFTAGFSVNVGDPTKASDVDVLAANDDYLKNAIDTFIANDANNRVLTGTGSGTANAETNLTFDGSTLTVTGTVSATTFSGNVTGGTISGTTGTFSSTLAVDTDTLYVDVSNDRVGVNQSSPTASFVVKAISNTLHALKIENAAGQSVTESYINGSGEPSLSLRNASGVQKIQISTHEPTYFNTGQNFGIGTSSPSCRAHIRESTLSGFTPDSNTNLAVEENSTSMIEIAGTDSGILFSDATAWAGRIFYTHSTDQMAFATAQSNKMILDSSGNLLIGTLSGYGTNKLNVNGGIAIDGRSASTPGLCEKGDVDTGIYWPAADTIAVTTGGTERLRVLATGGLTFNGDTAAANALDDYEEGTWTPTINGSTSDPTVTYAGQYGYYTKIGNTVHIWGYVWVTAGNLSGGAGTIRIGNTPFSFSYGTPGAYQALSLGYAQANGVYVEDTGTGSGHARFQTGSGTFFDLYGTNSTSWGSGAYEFSFFGSLKV